MNERMQKALRLHMEELAQRIEKVLERVPEARQRDLKVNLHTNYFMAKEGESPYSHQTMVASGSVTSSSEGMK
jgi:Xaa-Pro aminopeptidase